MKTILILSLMVSFSGFSKESNNTDQKLKKDESTTKEGYSKIDMNQFKDVKLATPTNLKATVSCKTPNGTTLKADQPGFESCTKQNQIERTTPTQKGGPNETAVEFQFSEKK